MQTQFTIKIQNKIFTSNKEGFLNLNEIHKAFDLGESKKPSKWRNKVSAYLFERTNLSLNKSMTYRILFMKVMKKQQLHMLCGLM